jgi:hypothetical protein
MHCIDATVNPAMTKTKFGSVTKRVFLVIFLLVQIGYIISRTKSLYIPQEVSFFEQLPLYKNAFQQNTIIIYIAVFLIKTNKDIDNAAKIDDL